MFLIYMASTPSQRCNWATGHSQRDADSHARARRRRALGTYFRLIDSGPLQIRTPPSLQRRWDRNARQSRAIDGRLNEAGPFGSLDELIQVREGSRTV